MHEAFMMAFFTPRSFCHMSPLALLGYGLDVTRESGFDSWQKQRIFLSSDVKGWLWDPCSLLSMQTGDTFLGGEATKLRRLQLALSSIKLKIAWNCLCRDISMMWSLIKYGDNFTFTRW